MFRVVTTFLVPCVEEISFFPEWSAPSGPVWDSARLAWWQDHPHDKAHSEGWAQSKNGLSLENATMWDGGIWRLHFFFLSLQLLSQFEWMWLQMCWPHLSRWLSQHHLQIRVPSCVQVIGFSPPECAPPSVLWHTFYCHRLESLFSSFSCSHVSSHPSFRYSLDHVLGGVGWGGECFWDWVSGWPWV